MTNRKSDGYDPNLRSGSIFVLLRNNILAGKPKRKQILAVAVRENVWEPLKLGLISSYCDPCLQHHGSKALAGAKITRKRSSRSIFWLMVTLFLKITEGPRKARSPCFAEVLLRPQPKIWTRGAGQNYPSSGEKNEVTAVERQSYNGIGRTTRNLKPADPLPCQ